MAGEYPNTLQPDNQTRTKTFHQSFGRTSCLLAQPQPTPQLHQPTGHTSSILSSGLATTYYLGLATTYSPTRTLHQPTRRPNSILYPVPWPSHNVLSPDLATTHLPAKTPHRPTGRLNSILSPGLATTYFPAKTLHQAHRADQQYPVSWPGYDLSTLLPPQLRHSIGLPTRPAVSCLLA